MQAFAGLNLMAPWASKSGSTTNATAAMGIVIDVPFDLVVGTYSLAAGTYRFEALRSPTPGFACLAVRGDRWKGIQACGEYFIKPRCGTFAIEIGFPPARRAAFPERTLARRTMPEPGFLSLAAGL